MNRKYFLVLILLFCSFLVFAGDVANYVNLGFSDNSKYFMFGLYGIDYKTTKPYADIYTVDVAGNKFAADGVINKLYSKNIQAGQDGSGALYNLLAENNDKLKEFNINHLNKGRIVYLLINGDESRDNLEFRDFKNNSRYKVSLIQQRFGSEKEPSASFHIALTVTDKNEKISTYTIGLPDYKRKDVMKYRIKQVMFAPDEKSLVFVIEKELLDGSGPSIRYMVETVKLK
jgi:predicted secreted protein